MSHTTLTGRNFINRAEALKGNLMRVFPVLFMEAEKSLKTVRFPFGAFMV